MRIRKPAKITTRSSSITNAFIQAILPTREISDKDKAEALEILGMKLPNLFCAYCGSDTSEWDHLFPLVRNKKPTGYIHEMRNLVPACGKCNHSKSGADWNVWFKSAKCNSPTRRGIKDTEERFNRLQRFVEWGNLKPIIFDNLLDKQELQEYWDAHAKLQLEMIAAQRLADKLKPLLQQRVDVAKVQLLVK